ncbi:MAG: pyridoxamine 5'-phosphate oxidase family protein [Proteobacteria bacterium]|nr:pyridoxamine 5'-phosphate oxidase family protein [Pseudomonadota bacterium]
MDKTQDLNPREAVRQLIRACDRAVLSTAQHDREGWPHGSLVLVACDQAATPLLFISDLAEHTRNIVVDQRVSLLFDGTEGLDDPLTGSRAAVFGRAERCDDASRARFLARHPSAAIYAGFSDFHSYRVSIERAHLVAGFGRIHWIDGKEIPGPSSLALQAAEADIVAHMNDDHADAVQAYASELLGMPGKGWRLTGCDSEGVDMRLDGKTARLRFAKPVFDAGGARAELVGLAKLARRESADR